MGAQCCTTDTLIPDGYIDMNPSRVRQKFRFKSIHSDSMRSNSHSMSSENYQFMSTEHQNTNTMYIKEVLINHHSKPNDNTEVETVHDYDMGYDIWIDSDQDMELEDQPQFKGSEYSFIIICVLIIHNH